MYNMLNVSTKYLGPRYYTIYNIYYIGTKKCSVCEYKCGKSTLYVWMVVQDWKHLWQFHEKSSAASVTIFDGTHHLFKFYHVCFTIVC